MRKDREIEGHTADEIPDQDPRKGGGDEPGRGRLTGVDGMRSLGVAIAIAFGLQSLRALFPSMVYVLKDRFGMSSAALGGVGFALFALAAWGPAAAKKMGTRRTKGGAKEFEGARAVTFAVAAMVGARVALQLWRGDPVGSLAAAACGAILFFVLWAAVLADRATQRGLLPPAFLFLFGASIDTAIHAAAGTRDLHWAHGASDFVTFALAAAAALCIAVSSSASRRAPEPRDETRHSQYSVMKRVMARASAIDPNFPPPFLSSSGAALFAIGPFLFLHLEWLSNVARLSAKTGLGSETAGAAIVGGFAIAMGVGAAAPISAVSRIVAAVVLVAATTASSCAGTFAIPIQLAAIVATATLLRDATSVSFRVFRFPALASAAGAVLLLILVFAHYAGYDLPLPWTRTHVWVAAATILSVVANTTRAQSIGEARHRFVVACAVVPAVLAVALVGASFLRPSPAAGNAVPATAAPSTTSILTFNLHAGFDERGGFAFDSMMEAVRAEDADVLALQEVSRGWLINGSADLYELARKSLPGDAAFGASVGGDWGNAVFSRAPITRIENVELPPRDLSLTRAVLAVEVTEGARTASSPSPSNAPSLRVLATHYHHRAADDSIREIHSRFIVEQFAQVETPSILLGDFNAKPDSPSLEILKGGGWIDVATRPGAGPTYPSRAPERRIDTIFMRGLDAVSQNVVPAWGSDHRGVRAIATRPVAPFIGVPDVPAPAVAGP